MRKRFYRTISLLLIFLLTVSSADLSAFASEQEEAAAVQTVSSGDEIPESLPEEAPAEEISEPGATDRPPLTYRPLEGEGCYESIRDHLGDMPLMSAMALLPERYDLSDAKDYLPPTRDQTPYGNCWAHALMAAAEIDFIKNRGYDRSFDLSELQLAYFMYNSPKKDPLGYTEGDSNILPSGYGNFLQFGGNVECAKKIMQGWIGAGEDKGDLAIGKAPYVMRYGLDEGYAFADVVHLQNYYNIGFSDYRQRDEIKKAVREYGVVTASYYEADRFYSLADNSYYCNEVFSGNHAVTVVGWDDNFPADKFRTKAPGNGAWLIRNSWSNASSVQYGRDTYFWISYYDKSLSGGVAFLFEPADNYANNYHYDGSAGDDVSILPSGVKVSNVFAAKGASDVETLRAVSFETDSSNVEYCISIYKNLTNAADPESGVFCGSTEGMTSFSGYYTVPLEQSIPLTHGETFSVVIKMSHANGDKVIVSQESSTTFFGARFTASSRSGESFYKYPDADAKWIDWGGYGTGNYRIKAFTDNSDENIPAVKLEFAESSIDLPYGETRGLPLSVFPEKASDRKIVWVSSDTGVVTASGGKITAVGLGTATVTAELDANPAIRASCEVTVKPRLEIHNRTANYDSYDEKVDYNGLILGRSFRLEAQCEPDTAPCSLAWKCDNPDVVEVTREGNAAIKEAGIAHITVYALEDPLISATVSVNVKYLERVYPSHAFADDYSTVSLTWAPVEGAVQYAISYGTEEMQYFAKYLADDCSCTIGDLTPGKKYKYLIFAYGPDGLISYTGEWQSFFVPWNHGVAYVLNGGINHPDNPKEVYEGKEYPLFEPTREGHVFCGWFTDRNYRSQPLSVIGSDNKEDITLYALWKLNFAAEKPEASIASGKLVPAGTRLYLKTETSGAEIYYTLDGSDPSVSPTRILYRGSIVLDRDVTLRAVTISQVYMNSPILEVSYMVRAGAGGWGDITEEDRQEKGFEFPADVPDAFWVAGIHDRNYTGKALTFPNMHVYWNKTMLTKGRDYTVRYSSNKNAGTATITISGKGNYSGKIVRYFKISVPDIIADKKFKNAKLNGLASDYVWEAGRVFEPEVGEDTVTFRLDGEEAPLKGLRKAEYEALPREAQMAYDYIYEYVGDTSSAGTLKLVFTGVNEFSGKKTHKYTVRGRKLSRADITGLKKKYTWTGESVNVAETVSITYTEDGGTTKLQGVWKPLYNRQKAAGLPVDAYDYVYDYIGNIEDCGTAEVVFSGVNRYSGTVRKSFKITAFQLNNADIEVADIGTVAYTKGGVTPGVYVTDLRNGRRLVMGLDYTLSYSNNKSVDYSWKLPTVKIKGIGNYTGTLKKTFTIVPSSLDNVKIRIGDVEYQKKGNICKPKIILTDSNGVKLKAGTDYQKTIRYQYLQDTTVKVARKENGTVSYSEEARLEGDDVLPRDIVPVGTEILATVKGRGNYGTGSIRILLFRYVAADLSKASVSVAPQSYTGEEIEPQKEDIKVILGGRRLNDEDYEIVEYMNNIQKGTAQIVIRGIGKYGGIKTTNFNIKSKKMSNAVIYDK